MGKEGLGQHNIKSEELSSRKAERRGLYVYDNEEPSVNIEPTARNASLESGTMRTRCVLQY